MTDRVELFYSTYRHFTDPVSDAVRKETFGADIGQNSWLTVDEYERLLPWLDLSPDDHVLEVASGSGGPALYVAHATGCRVTGIDANESAVAVASQAAARTGASERVRFRLADATSRLPFEDDAFDGLLCVDAMNHFPQRLSVFREWRRVLR
ncbi:MAG: class I SAM-dependent methyltransferase, partial [Acidobacteriota bacterium]|nr:class I SAM-dependent methyltransferase [Acidobacteriota bacterium]